MLTGMKRHSHGRREASWLRKLNRLPAVPTIRARPLVALATTAPVPVNMRAGNVRTVPPPATALMAPAASAEAKRVRISQEVMSQYQNARAGGWKAELPVVNHAFQWIGNLCFLPPHFVQSRWAGIFSTGHLAVLLNRTRGPGIGSSGLR